MDPLEWTIQHKAIQSAAQFLAFGTSKPGTAPGQIHVYLRRDSTTA
jgi:hypothetical protein